MPRGGRYRPPEYTARVLAAYDAAEGKTRTARAKAAAAVAGVDRATVLRVVAERDGDGRDGKGPGAGRQVFAAPAVAQGGQRAGGEARAVAPAKPTGAGMRPRPPAPAFVRYSPADRRVVERWVVCTDVHYGCHDPDAVDLLYQAINVIRPSAFCDLGDIGEWEALSRHRKTKQAPPEYLIPEWREAIAEVNDYLDERDDVLDRAGVRRRVQFCGNHDRWLDDVAADHPLHGEFAFAVAIRAAARKLEVVPHGDWFPLAPGLLGTHGDAVRTSIGHPRALLAKSGGASILYGDKHVVSTWLEPGRDPMTGRNVQREATCLGTLKDRRPEANPWLRGDTHRWGAALGQVDVFGDGRWSVTLHRMDGGRMPLWGEVLTARERRAA